MTSPSPLPTMGGPLGSLTGQIDKELAASSGSTTSSTADDSLYGLGEWANQNINPGDLPILPALIGTGKQTTGNNIAAAFASGSPTAIAQIQRALYLGGFYGQNSTFVPTYGVVSTQDISAFAKAVQVAGQSKTSVAQTLLTHAEVGTAAGIATATTQASAVSKVSMPNTQDLEAEAVKAFQEELGRKATPSEQAAFAASYRALSAGVQRAGNQALFNAKTGSDTITPQQGQTLDDQLGQVGAPVSGTQGNTGNASLNDTLLNEQDTNATTPTFESQLASLGDIAQETQQDATPNLNQPGLTQVDEESAPSPDVAAEDYAQNAAPKEADATSLANQFDSFLNILGTHFGGSSG